MKRALILSIVVSSINAGLYATTVTFGGIPTARTVVDASLASNPLNSSASILVGTFANSSFVVDLNSTARQNFDRAVTAVGGGWRTFGDPSTPAGAPLDINASGKVGGSVIDNRTLADTFNSNNIFLWIFNGGTIDTSTQMGIFRSPDATVPWLFPTNAGGVLDSVTLSSTSSAAPTVVAIGGAGSVPTAQMKLVQLVPEPSTALLLMFGSVALAIRRRRSV